MSKILHLIPDEKFTNDVITNFDLVTDNNIYIIFGDRLKNKFNVKVGNNVIWLNESELSQYQIPLEVIALIVHGLNYNFSKFILDLPKEIKICWFAWGYDIYLLPKIQRNIYGLDTLKYLRSKNRFYNLIQFVKNNPLLRKIYFRIFLNKPDYFLTYEKAHKRINYFCTYIVEDFEIFQKYYPNKMKYLEIGYFSINQYLGNSSGEKIELKRGNILVGNSNSVENNHLDLFSRLKNYSNNIGNFSIICPLNYGENQSYKNEVCKKGNELFKNNFKPLLDFLSREEYIELLKTCSAAIFYHFRQQAMGNIIALLYMGCRVYLSKINPVYSYLKRIGIVIFDFDSDFEHYLNTPLSSDETINNRTILEAEFSAEDIINQTSCFIKLLTDECKESS